MLRQLPFDRIELCPTKPCFAAAHPLLRGWQNTVGNIIDIAWLKNNCHGPISLIYAGTPEGHGFIEFEI